MDRQSRVKQLSNVLFRLGSCAGSEVILTKLCWLLSYAAIDQK